MLEYIGVAFSVYTSTTKYIPPTECITSFTLVTTLGHVRLVLLCMLSWKLEFELHNNLLFVLLPGKDFSTGTADCTYIRISSNCVLQMSFCCGKDHVFTLGDSIVQLNMNIITE